MPRSRRTEREYHDKRDNRGYGNLPKPMLIRPASQSGYHFASNSVQELRIRAIGRDNLTEKLKEQYCTFRLVGRRS